MDALVVELGDPDAADRARAHQVRRGLGALAASAIALSAAALGTVVGGPAWILARIAGFSAAALLVLQVAVPEQHGARLRLDAHGLTVERLAGNEPRGRLGAWGRRADPPAWSATDTARFGIESVRAAMDGERLRVEGPEGERTLRVEAEARDRVDVLLERLHAMQRARRAVPDEPEARAAARALRQRA